MALIKCPECGREKVSDSAQACPGCGFGIKDYYSKLEQDRLREELKKEEAEKQAAAKAQADAEMEWRLQNVEMPEKPSMVVYLFLGVVALIGIIVYFANGSMLSAIITPICGAVAASGLSVYKKKVKEYEMIMNNPDEYRKKVIAMEDEQREQGEWEEEYDATRVNDAPRCPNCGSTYIATINRGYSIVSGFIGSGQAKNVCQKCGHTWKP